MKMTIFWAVAPCIVIDIDRRFRGAYCLNNKAPEFYLDDVTFLPRVMNIDQYAQELRGICFSFSNH
jgi:hypothetical protein